MSFLLSLFPNLSLGYRLLAMAFPVSPLFSLNYIYPFLPSPHHMFFKEHVALYLMCYGSPAFTIPSIFLTNRGFFSFSILNPFSRAKVIFINRPIALLSSNALTATPLWFSSFSSPTFIQTSLSSCRVHYISLTLSVVLVQLNLFPSFSGCNTLYRLLKASRELTILHFLLPTPTAFPLPFLYAFPNSFWPYGPTSHTYSTSCPLLLLCLYPLHLGLFLDPFKFPLY